MNVNLPINQGATYTITIPSSGKQIKFRQFLVKEQKALLIAQQSNDEMVMYDTLKDVVKNCIKDPIDIDKLALFDIEYLFVMIRAKSVGEMVEINLLCPECNDPKAKVVYNIDLENIKVDKSPKHINKIHLFDDVGVVMKYPSFETLRLLKTSNLHDPNEAINVIISCIDYIYNTEQVFKSEDATKEQLTEFIENLDDKQLNLIKDFLRTMPRIYVDIEYTCPVCDKTHKKRLEGLASFF